MTPANTPTTPTTPKYYRSHYSYELCEKNIGETVILSGWVFRRRDHGGLIFIDLRDNKEHVQLVCHPENQASFALAQKLRSEFVIKIQGDVRARPEGTTNPTLHSGGIEVVIDQIQILNTCRPLPFTVDNEEPLNTGEETRLSYRYLDLRHPNMQKTIRMRSQINHVIRDHLSRLGFLDIETPCLTKSTPEGARDFLVASRHNQGQFYALPQSPQIFKQLLMISGFDRYYQIVRCFRDEDLRADRQPEFTQLDIEMAFVNEEDVMQMAESLIIHCFQTILNINLGAFPHMPYQEAMEKYGIDKPDLRNPLHLIELKNHLCYSEFKVFQTACQAGRIAALRLPLGATQLSRKAIDDYTAMVIKMGAKGLAYIKVNDVVAGREGLQSPILKFLSDEDIQVILEKTQVATGDLIFFGAGDTHTVNLTMSHLIHALGKDLNLLSNDFKPLWVTKFPLFEKDEDGQLYAMHHPFTAPCSTQTSEVEAHAASMGSRAYDLVINGYEIGGGSIRIHQIEMQKLIFKLLNMNEEDAHAQFSHLLNALEYGCPPHGGIAFGLDRLTMVMSHCQSIREVIAFPKTQSGSCPLTHAPSYINTEQLQELKLKVITPPSK